MFYILVNTVRNNIEKKRLDFKYYKYKQEKKQRKFKTYQRAE